MKLIEKLKTKLPINILCSVDKAVPNTPNWITKVAKVFKKHPEYNTSILGSLVQAAVATMNRASNNVKVNAIV